MARSSIGLDIGTRAVRLAEVQVLGGTPTLTRFGRMLLPLGAVDHGEIADPQAVATAVMTLWKRLGLTGKAVHVGVANRRVVVRVIELPAMSRDDLPNAIRFQAQEHIPIPLDQAVMDFEVLDELESAEGEKTQRVLVVAAERATIEPLLAAVRESRLELASLELNAYPLVRCFGDLTGSTQAVVDIGAGVTNLVVHRDGKIRFTRILPTFGGDEFTQAVAQGLGVHRDEAETLKRRASHLLSERASRPVSASVGSAASYATAVGSDVSYTSDVSGPSSVLTDEGDEAGTEDASSGPEAEGFASPRPRPVAPGSRPVSVEAGTSVADTPSSPVEHAAVVIEPLLDRFTTEVRGSLDFYASQPGAPAVDRVVLTGGGALMGGIAERLQASLGIPVEFGHPFERVPIGRVQVSSEERSVAEPFLGVAIGLALAGVK
jgi:type IV pilus assembly protein PilM